MPKTYFLSFLLLSLAFRLAASDLGVHGQTFPLREEDLLELLRTKIEGLSADDLEKIQQGANERVVEGVKRPRVSHRLPKACQNRVFYFDPSITLRRPIADHLGNVVVAAGASVNPLDKVPWIQDLIFFDGDDPEQLQWVRGQGKDAKWILTSGRPMELERHEQRPVYFDQGGVLTNKLGISCVPARVSLEGRCLRIEEICLGELP